MWQIFGKLGGDLPQDPAVTPLVTYPKDSVLYYSDTCSFTSTAPAETGSCRDAHQQMNGLLKCGGFAQWNIVYLFKKVKSCVGSQDI